MTVMRNVVNRVVSLCFKFDIEIVRIAMSDGMESIGEIP
jgi:hypothetical protein